MLNDALKLIRVYHNLKQVDAAKLLDISQPHLSELEKGSKQPTIEILERYSKAFKMPVSSILYFSERKSAKKEDKLADAIATKALQMLTWVETITNVDSKARHT